MFINKYIITPNNFFFIAICWFLNQVQRHKLLFSTDNANVNSKYHCRHSFSFIVFFFANNYRLILTIFLSIFSLLHLK